MLYSTYTSVWCNDGGQNEPGIHEHPCGAVEQTAQFYQDLLGLRRARDFGWFILLADDALPGFELGILDKDHEIVPKTGAQAFSGVLLTFVVTDVEATFRQAVALGAEVVESPRDMPYGQRRFIVRDPAGTLVDVSAPIRPD
ncbi:MAG: glyoxalase [Rhodobacteraceae bacterium]|nr:glyoxalase [Paracoccaceae bacterium]